MHLPGLLLLRTGTVVVVVVVFVVVVVVVAFSRVAPPQDRDCIDPCGVRLKFFDGGNRE